MSTRLLLNSLLIAFLVTGCASPVLTIPEPNEQQRSEAQSILSNAVLSDPNLLGNLRELETGFENIATPVVYAANRVCQRLQARIPTMRCQAAFRMPQLYRNNDVNAFADEQDTVGVYTGLLLRSRVESEIAAVLAHEYAHVMLGHVGKKGTNMAIGSILGSLGRVAYAASTGQTLNPQAASALEKIGRNVGSRIYSPEMEIEADRVAVYILKEARHPVLALRDLLVRLHRLKLPTQYGGASMSRVGFLETHPSDDRRVAHALAAITDAVAGVPLTKK